MKGYLKYMLDLFIVFLIGILIVFIEWKFFSRRPEKIDCIIIVGTLYIGKSLFSYIRNKRLEKDKTETIIRWNEKIYDSEDDFLKKTAVDDIPKKED